MHTSKLTEKQKFWRERLETQIQSGLSRKDFCEQHGLNAQHMDHYASILRKKLGEPRAESGFVKVMASPSVEKITVRLAGGVSIECSCDARAVKEVVKAVLEVH